MKPRRHCSARLATAVLCALAPAAQAASVYLTPAAPTALVGNQLAFDLVMDFAPNEATLGGGIDIDLANLTGSISFASFTASPWFNSGLNTAPDPAFSGHGTLRADADYEVHIGNFNGMSGMQVLGTLVVNGLGVGNAEIRLATNTFFGGFFGINSLPQTVTMTGATVTIVPEPSTALLWLLGAGAVGTFARRRLNG